ncbi:SLAP domain-containing protein [Alkalibacillus aidingensis]|uniref:SLAP domain-containing protein n=1 Tax=Alkalibacillus aidingensis TaxID=2747607 RepID=UPI001660BDE4|nr:SLAP domain-containing protein [Alkalibacillus aidingensis]
MQKLVFESKWEQTISEQDRQKIESTFNKINIPNHQVRLTPLWQAVNHKGELLVTTLIHNSTNQSLSFNNTKVQYDNRVEALFTLPISIDPQTSMPWTFIFPEHPMPEKLGQLKIVE